MPPQNQPPQPPPPNPPQPSAPPAPAPAPAAEHRSSSLLSILIALIILLAVAAGAYFVWQSGLLKSIMPQQSQEQEPAQTETSDLEAELDSVDVGSDAEIDSLEAQL